MTSDAQRVAIAEACGWRPYGEGKNPAFWFRPESRSKELHHTHQLPNYTTDLNAMHDAEWFLIKNENWEAYSDCLMEMVMRGGGYQNAFFYFHASAAMRAEAFLRALNLWDDSK